MPEASEPVDGFDRVIFTYFTTWIGALDLLQEPFPFAAACLACVMLDHLGNARIQRQRPLDQHADTYERYIRKYLVPEGFPDNQELCARFYRTLRSGLVHEARTDDHRSDAQNAALVTLSRDSNSPVNVGPNTTFNIGVPWLCGAIKAAWEKTRVTQEPALRAQIARRLAMVVAYSDTTAVARIRSVAVAGAGTFATPGLSGVGPNFQESRMNEIEERAAELTVKNYKRKGP